ncbi:uncharacterized protein TEOVI_000607100 [Trypanosoma equiperdum]|uniref:Uncharacterized protein n=1 Tax=Trypanosoma equiperdum TaxID=5694 RepID=A0A1G4I490_TRYEQ|nr:hypothetical protein TEOVI_000607100 [Trypanosoma equiperdum]
MSILTILFCAVDLYRTQNPLVAADVPEQPPAPVMSSVPRMYCFLLFVPCIGAIVCWNAARACFMLSLVKVGVGARLGQLSFIRFHALGTFVPVLPQSSLAASPHSLQHALARFPAVPAQRQSRSVLRFLPALSPGLPSDLPQSFTRSAVVGVWSSSPFEALPYIAWFAAVVTAAFVASKLAISVSV